MPVGADLADNLPDLGLETHVQHTIGLVHDKVGDTAQVGFARLKHVNQATGGRDDNLNTTLEITDLGALGGTTVDGGVTNAGVGTVARKSESANLQLRREDVPKLRALLLDLNGQLTRRSKDKSDRTITRSQEWLAKIVKMSNQTTRMSQSMHLRIDMQHGGECE